MDINSVGGELGRIALDGSPDPRGASALQVLKARHPTLLSFCQAHSEFFVVKGDNPAHEYQICLVKKGNEVAVQSGESVPSEDEGGGVSVAEPMVALEHATSEDEIYGNLVSLNATLVQGMSPASCVTDVEASVPRQKIASSVDATQTVPELKAVLRGLGLRVGGTKKELLERLEAHQRSALYGWSTKSG